MHILRSSTLFLKSYGVCAYFHGVLRLPFAAEQFTISDKIPSFVRTTANLCLCARGYSLVSKRS